MTAHPKIDPVTGHMHSFGYGFVPPYLTYHEVDATGTLVRSEVIDVAGPTMIHDFAVTDRDVVFWELPVVFDLEVAMSGEGMPFSWQPEYGGRIGVLGFGEPGSATRWVEIDPCYVFHGLNAYRDGDDVVLDVCRLPSMFDEGGGDLEPSAVHRWRVDTGGEQLGWSDEQLSDIEMDLPNIDRRYTGRPYRHAWLAETVDDEEYGFEFAGITRLDVTTGHTDRWVPERHERAGEGFFVPDAEDEGEGWVLAFAYDRTVDRSHLAVLDATDLAAGPVARVRLPVRVPYGFHAVWVDEADLDST